MSIPANRSQLGANAITLADFQRAAQQAQGRALEIDRGQVMVSPGVGRGFSAKVYKLFRSIAEALKIVKSQEGVHRERHERQVLANKRFQALVSNFGVPLSGKNQLLRGDEALTGHRVLEVMSSADIKRLNYQREAMNYIEQHPELQLETVKKSLETHTGKPLADLLAMNGAAGSANNVDQRLQQSPIWTEYEKNLQTLVANFSLRASADDPAAEPSGLLSHVRGMNEDEIKTAMQDAARLAVAFAVDPDQADVCSRGFQQAEKSLTQFFQEASAKSPYATKRLCESLVKFRLGLEKAGLSNPLTGSSRHHIFEIMVERSLSNLDNASLNNLKNNLKQCNPALLGLLAGINSYYEQASPEDDQEALDFVETMNDIVRFMNINDLVGESMPNLLSEATTLANQQRQDSSSSRLASTPASVADGERKMQFNMAMRNTEQSLRNRFQSDEIANAYKDLHEAHALFHPQEVDTEDEVEVAADTPPPAKSTVTEQAEKVASKVSDKLEQVAEHVGEQVSHAAGKAKHAAGKAKHAVEMAGHQVGQAVEQVGEQVGQAVEQVGEQVGQAVERHKLAQAASTLGKKVAQEKAEHERIKHEEELHEKGAVRLRREQTEQRLEEKQVKRQHEAAQAETVRKARQATKQVFVKKVRQRKKTEKYMRQYEARSGMDSGPSAYAVNPTARRSSAAAEKTAATATTASTVASPQHQDTEPPVEVAPAATTSPPETPAAGTTEPPAEVAPAATTSSPEQPTASPTEPPRKTALPSQETEV